MASGSLSDKSESPDGQGNYVVRSWFVNVDAVGKWLGVRGIAEMFGPIPETLLRWSHGMEETE